MTRASTSGVRCSLLVRSRSPSASRTPHAHRPPAPPLYTTDDYARRPLLFDASYTYCELSAVPATHTHTHTVEDRATSCNDGMLQNSSTRVLLADRSWRSFVWPEKLRENLLLRVQRSLLLPASPLFMCCRELEVRYCCWASRACVSCTRHAARRVLVRCRRRSSAARRDYPI